MSVGPWLCTPPAALDPRARSSKSLDRRTRCPRRSPSGRRSTPPGRRVRQRRRRGGVDGRSPTSMMPNLGQVGARPPAAGGASSEPARCARPRASPRTGRRDPRPTPSRTVTGVPTPRAASARACRRCARGRGSTPMAPMVPARPATRRGTQRRERQPSRPRRRPRAAAPRASDRRRCRTWPSRARRDRARAATGSANSTSSSAVTTDAGRARSTIARRSRAVRRPSRGRMAAPSSHSSATTSSQAGPGGRSTATRKPGAAPR